MTPALRKQLSAALAPGESDTYHNTATAFTDPKEAIEWLKAFRNGEKKKRTQYQRPHLVADADMQITKWEAKAKRIAETPVECPKCKTPGFLPAGLKSHLKKCDGTKREALAKPAKKAIDGKAEVVKQDDLPSLAAGLQFAQEGIDGILTKAAKEALPLRLRQGLHCLKAQAIFALSPAERAALGGKAKAAKSEPDKAESEESEPADFAGWLAVACPALSKGSAYDFIGAVKGLGLTSESTDKELTKAYTDARKAADKAGATLSIAKLKNLAPKEGGDDDGEEEDKKSPEALAKEAEQQALNWITNWDKTVKAGNLEHASKATLKKLHEFMTTEREKIAARMKGTKA